ncbi:MAG: Lipid carrier : UDP-N-acetylgalactosaminyltransferase, partial [uncultured Chloroflexia bacterium]
SSTTPETLIWHAILEGSSLRQWYVRFLKRFVDMVVASTLLLILSPLLVLVAIAIHLDSPGPFLFRQTRIGRENRSFSIYKFRTMTHRPNDELVLVRDADGVLRHKVRNDPRVTRVGRWLRRTSIDELPQLLNILMGQMSLVGPRPELPQIVETYESWQHRRHLVRPGLTGWWQVSGRSDRPMHEHTELDIYYVEHQSFWLDVRILLLTMLVVVKGLGAF